MDRRRRLKPDRPPQRRTPAIDLDDVIYGVHAVDEALAAKEGLRAIYVGDERKRDPALRGVIAKARDLAISIRFESRSFFSQFPYRAHQSVVAVGEAFEYISIEEAIALKRGANRLLVVLDHITDPHNAGAIIRSAECAGADAVVLPERRAAGVNPTVRKVAAGATAHMPVARVANVANALRSMRKAGIWVAGAAAEGATPYTEVDYDRDLAIVVGAEGAGISQVVRKECDYLITIPLLGRVSSLNASVAAGVLLFEALRQRDGACRTNHSSSP
jgi:23S rRNA (guanosine2251-2'-O)-methyltransferase